MFPPPRAGASTVAIRLATDRKSLSVSICRPLRIGRRACCHCCHPLRCRGSQEVLGFEGAPIGTILGTTTSLCGNTGNTGNKGGLSIPFQTPYSSGPPWHHSGNPWHHEPTPRKLSVSFLR